MIRKYNPKQLDLFGARPTTKAVAPRGLVEFAKTPPPVVPKDNRVLVRQPNGWYRLVDKPEPPFSFLSGCSWLSSIEAARAFSGLSIELSGIITSSPWCATCTRSLFLGRIPTPLFKSESSTGEVLKGQTFVCSEGCKREFLAHRDERIRS